MSLEPTFRTIAKGEATPTDNSAVKTAASDTKSAYAKGRLRQRGLGLLTRVRLCFAALAAVLTAGNFEVRNVG